MAFGVRAPIEIVSADAGHCVARYEHVLLLAWRDQVSVESLRAVREAHFAILRKHPGGVGCLTVGTGARIPEASLGEAASIARETYKNVRWAACVISGEGFVASVARAGLTSVLSLAGQSGMVRIFRELPSALAWQKSHPSGLGVSPVALSSAAEQVDAALRKRAESA